MASRPLKTHSPTITSLRGKAALQRAASTTRIFVSVTALLGVLGAQALPSGFTAGPIAKAVEQAGAQKCAVLIDFSSAACEPCRRLEAVWNSEELQEWIGEHAVAVRVDPEQDAAAAKQHRVDAYPTILLLAADGSELGRVVGYFDADAMRQRLDALLETQSTDPKTRERIGDELRQKGDHEGALGHYLWYWDHGLEHDRALTGVRGSFFLRKLAEFAERYPPARAALEARRDEAERRVLAGKTDLRVVSDMAKLNEHLGTRDRSLRTLQKVPAARWRGSEIARWVLFESVLDLLIEQKKYREILDLAGDPLAALARDLRTNRLLPAQLRAVMNDRRINKYAPMVEAFFGVGDGEVATALADRLLELRPDATTWSLLITAAQRAGDDVASHDLAVRAMQELPEEDHAAIRLLLRPKRPK